MSWTPVPPTPIDLPLSAGDLTDDWLTRALRCAAVVGVNERVQASAVEPVATGAASQTVRVSAVVADARNPTPLRLIVKLPTSNPTIARANRIAGWSAHEIDFYRNCSPRLTVLTPKFYFGHVDADGKGVLVLEDLSHDVTLTAGDIDAGCSQRQAEQVLRTLADLHQPSTFRQLASASWPPPFMHIAQRQQGADPRADRWARWRAERGESLGERARRVGDRMARGAVSSIRRVADSSPVLLHGDCKADNMFFRQSGEPIIFDWQLVSRGAGAFDVAFFFSSSVAPEVRRSLEMTSLRTYYDEAAITPAYDAWFDLYRHCVNVAFYRTATSVSLHNSAQGSAKSLLETLVGRQATAIDDLRADEVLTS